MQARIRKQRKEMIYKQQERQRKIIEISSLTVVGLLAAALMEWIASAVASKVKAHELCGEFQTGYAICINEGYDQAHASMFNKRFPKHERYISCKLAQFRPYLDNSNGMKGMQCRYRFPNQDSFTIVTYEGMCPEQLTCTVSN